MKLRLINDNVHAIVPTDKKVVAWQGEKVYLRFVLEDAKKAEIKIEGKGATFRLYQEKKVKAFTGHAGWYAYNPLGIMPFEREKVKEGDLLSPLTKTVTADEPCVIWVEADILKGNEELSSVWTLTAKDGMDTVSADINVKILSVVLPTPTEAGFSMELWQYPYSVAEYFKVEPFSEQHLQILKKTQSFYKQYGGDGVTVTIVEEAWGGQTYSAKNPRCPSMIKWIKKKDGWAFDYTEFDAWIRLNIEVGLGNKFCCYSPLPWRSMLRFYDEKRGKMVKKIVPLSDFRTYTAYWEPFFLDFIKHLDENDWFEKMVIAFDERDKMGGVLDFVQSFRNKDGKSFRMTSAFSAAHIGHAHEDYFESAAAGIGVGVVNRDIMREFAAKRRAEGKKTYLYTATDTFPSSFTLSAPVENYLTMAFCAACHTDGFLRWALDAWVKEPLIDTTHWSFPAGDCFLIYPDENYGYTLSVRFVKLFESLQDMIKLRTLAARDSKTAKKVADILDTVRVDYDNYRQKKSFFIAPWRRCGTWITEKGLAEMDLEMTKLKTGVNELSEKAK